MLSFKAGIFVQYMKGTSHWRMLYIFIYLLLTNFLIFLLHSLIGSVLHIQHLQVSLWLYVYSLTSCLMWVSATSLISHSFHHVLTVSATHAACCRYYFGLLDETLKLVRHKSPVLFTIPLKYILIKPQNLMI